MTRNHDGNELVRRTRLLAHAVSRRDLLRALAAAGAGAALTGAIRGEARAAGGIASSATRGRSRAQDTPVQGGTLTAAITGQPDNMDPHKAGIYASLQIYDNIYSKLVYVDPDLNFLPGLAVSWTNPSPTEWQFELVQNAVFHNGEKFTAADVKFTFDRLKDPATASPAATLFGPIKAVEPIDDYHVKFTLEEPFGPFLSHLAGSGQIVNEKAVAAADPARNPVGTGPFKFVEWVTDDHLTVERWDQHYKEGKPHLDRVIFRGMGVDESRMAALQSGEVNWVDAVPLQKVPEVRDGGEFNYYTAATAGLPDYVAMNTTKPPFDNVKLRQAVAWATDRNAILLLAYSGVGEVANEEVASGNAWHSGSTTYSEAPDIEKAKALLAESGFDVNQKITYLGLPQYPELLRTGEILKENLAAIGLNMEIEQQEVTVWAQNFLGKNYEITSGYWSSILDPDDFFHQIFLSTSPSNFTGYVNPTMDQLVTDARAGTEFDARKALYTQARALLNQDVPLTFVHYELLNYATAKNVQGTQIYPSMELRFEDVWIAE
jgi:peptide/nickel transport system substrate-binding protein